jgi:transcriptional accessory protein Tex/SPT6
MTEGSELAVREERVAAAVALLDDGATVPFIAKSIETYSEAVSKLVVRRSAHRAKP